MHLLPPGGVVKDVEHALLLGGRGRAPVKAPCDVQHTGQNRDPHASPSISLAEDLDADPSRIRHGVGEGGQPEYEQSTGGKITSPRATIEHEQRSETRGSRSEDVVVESAHEPIRPGAEEPDDGSRGQCWEGPHAAACQGEDQEGDRQVQDEGNNPVHPKVAEPEPWENVVEAECRRHEVTVEVLEDLSGVDVEPGKDPRPLVADHRDVATDP
jgi:hypothetical protein